MTKPSPSPSPLKARAAAFFAGLLGSGVTMSEDEKKALEAAQQAVAQEGDAVPALAAAASEGVSAGEESARIEALQKQLASLTTALEAQKAEAARKISEEQAAAAAARAGLAEAAVKEREEKLMALKREGLVKPAADKFTAALLASDQREAFLAFLAANGPYAGFKNFSADDPEYVAMKERSVDGEQVQRRLDAKGANGNALNADLADVAAKAAAKNVDSDEPAHVRYKRELIAAARKNPGLVDTPDSL